MSLSMANFTDSCESAGKQVFKYLPLSFLRPVKLFCGLLAEVRKSFGSALSEPPRTCTVRTGPGVCRVSDHVQGIGRNCQNHHQLVTDSGPWGGRRSKTDKGPF